MHYGGSIRYCIMGVCWKMIHYLHDCMANTAYCMKETEQKQGIQVALPTQKVDQSYTHDQIPTEMQLYKYIYIYMQCWVGEKKLQMQCKRLGKRRID